MLSRFLHRPVVLLHVHLHVTERENNTNINPQ